MPGKEGLCKVHQIRDHPVIGVRPEGSKLKTVAGLLLFALVGGTGIIDGVGPGAVGVIFGVCPIGDDKYLDVIASYMLIDAYIKQYALGVTKQIIDATFERFSAEDKSITDDYYLSNDRAMFISECEANSILNYRQYSKAVKAGKTKKKWIDIGDKRERKTHLEVGGTILPIDEPFSVGDSLLQFPKDTSLGASSDEIVNCRCSIQYS